jgi:hypothetical protein
MAAVGKFCSGANGEARFGITVPTSILLRADDAIA